MINGDAAELNEQRKYNAAEKYWGHLRLFWGFPWKIMRTSPAFLGLLGVFTSGWGLGMRHDFCYSPDDLAFFLKCKKIVIGEHSFFKCLFIVISTTVAVIVTAFSCIALNSICLVCYYKKHICSYNKCHNSWQIIQIVQYHNYYYEQACGIVCCYK